MKAIIVCLITVLTLSTANARSILLRDLATYSFGLNIDSSNYLVDATLTDFGYMNINVRAISSDPLDNFAPVQYNTLIKTQTYQLLLQSIQSLSTAKVNITDVMAVCMMMPSFEQSTDTLSVLRGFDHSNGTYSGQVEEVHGPKGCWVSHKVSLAYDSLNSTALQLKLAIKVLALEAISDDLTKN